MGRSDEELKLLLGGDTREFDRALAKVALQHSAGGPERAAYIADVVNSLSSTGLAGRELDRRIRLLFDALRPSETEFRTAIGRLQDASPAALNAIRSALPPSLRPLTVASQATTIASGATPQAEPPPRVPTPPGPLPTFDESRHFQTVALVGTETEQSGNVAMLNRHGFQPLRVPNLEALWQVAATGLCGFVVAPTGWLGLSEQQQRDAIVRLCSWSTFTFARLSLQGLADSISGWLPSVIRETRSAGAGTERFCHGSSADLTAADVELLRSAATLLEDADQTRFVPLGIDHEQAMLLRLIAGQRRSSPKPVEVRRLGTREMHGGKSGARLYLLQGEVGRPFVVKLDEPPRLQEELRRHQDWIAAWEPNLTDPLIHHHLGRAAISYRLQPHADGADLPAPTLEDELMRLRSEEWIEASDGTNSADASATSLQAAVFRAADRLTELNKKPATSDGSEFWLNWPIRDLAKRALKHAITGIDGREYELAALTEAAVALLQPLQGRGVVHGDIHGRNVLLIDRVPAFIDYATSGPGHPLVDLVRLDATVRHISMRALCCEADLAKVFGAIHVTGSPPDDILPMIPALAASAACRLAIRSAAKTRTCGLQVADHFGCGLKEYLAMVCVVAGHILAVRTPGSVVERALLAALAPHL